jgi:hypothetical protein
MGIRQDPEHPEHLHRHGRAEQRARGAVIILIGAEAMKLARASESGSRAASLVSPTLFTVRSN